MIAVSVSILSVLWLAIAFAWVPPPGGFDSAISDWVLIGIDAVVLVLGVVTVVLAVRQKYPWLLAIVFVLAPICHAIGYLPWGELKILFFGIPLVPIILVVVGHFALKAFGRSNQVI